MVLLSKIMRLDVYFFALVFDEFTRLKSYERPKNIFHSEILVDGTSIYVN